MYWQFGGLQPCNDVSTIATTPIRGEALMTLFSVCLGAMEGNCFEVDRRSKDWLICGSDT